MSASWVPAGDSVGSDDMGGLKSRLPIYSHSVCGYVYIGSDPPEKCPLCELVNVSLEAQLATNLALGEQLTLAKILRRKHDAIEKRVDALVLRVHGLKHRLRALEPV